MPCAAWSTCSPTRRPMDEFAFGLAVVVVLVAYLGALAYLIWALRKIRDLY